jgi:hypothetical protein
LKFQCQNFPKILKEVLALIIHNDYFINDLQTDIPQKKLYIGSWSWVTPRPKPKTKINLGLDSEFNSINFGMKINKCLKYLTPISLWV